jgi:hypothetical protein
MGQLATLWSTLWMAINAAWWELRHFEAQLTLIEIAITMVGQASQTISYARYGEVSLVLGLKDEATDALADHRVALPKGGEVLFEQDFQDLMQ